MKRLSSTNQVATSHKTLNLSSLWSWTSQAPELLEIRSHCFSLSMLVFCYANLNWQKCSWNQKSLFNSNNLNSGISTSRHTYSEGHLFKFHISFRIFLSIFLISQFPHSSVWIHLPKPDLIILKFQLVLVLYSYPP